MDFQPPSFHPTSLVIILPVPAEFCLWRGKMADVWSPHHAQQSPLPGQREAWCRGTGHDRGGGPAAPLRHGLGSQGGPCPCPVPQLPAHASPRGGSEHRHGLLLLPALFSLQLLCSEEVKAKAGSAIVLGLFAPGGAEEECRSSAVSRFGCFPPHEFGTVSGLPLTLWLPGQSLGLSGQTLRWT